MSKQMDNLLIVFFVVALGFSIGPFVRSVQGVIATQKALERPVERQVKLKAIETAPKHPRRSKAFLDGLTKKQLASYNACNGKLDEKICLMVIGKAGLKHGIYYEEPDGRNHKTRNVTRRYRA